MIDRLKWIFSFDRHRHPQPRQFGILFLLMVLWILAFPFASAEPEEVSLLGVAFAFIAAQALSITARSPRERLLLVAWSALLFLAPLIEVPDRLIIVEIALVGAILIYVPIRLSAFVLEQDVVDRSTIFGALCAYLFLGMSWTLVYEQLVRLDPTAIVAPGGENQSLTTWLYFSFTTLTTLGFGDVVPRSAPARMLTILEALIGQIYLVVVVARLVGMQLSSKSRTEI